jgi:hypothetical protein
MVSEVLFPCSHCLDCERIIRPNPKPKTLKPMREPDSPRSTLGIHNSKRSRRRVEQLVYKHLTPENVENDNVEIHSWSFVWLSAVTI